jgi:sulfofructose kinase
MNTPIIVLGNATMDHVFNTDKSICNEEKVSIRFMREYSGGQAANAAVALAGLGFQVDFVGAFGDERDGTWCRKQLESRGCRTEHSVTIPNSDHHSAIILVNQLTGDRRIAMYRPTQLTVPQSAISEDLMNGAAAVYTDSHEMGASLQAIALAQRLGIRTFCDGETVSSELVELFHSVTEVIAPATVLLEATGMRSVESALKAVSRWGVQAVVATLGAEGCLGFDAVEGRGGAPGLDVPVVDTTGAGDAFHAAYIAARLAGWPFQRCLEFSNEVGAAACSQHGPQLSISTLTAFRRKLDRPALGSESSFG